MGIEGRERPSVPSPRLPGQGGAPGRRPAASAPAPSLLRLDARPAQGLGPGAPLEPRSARPGPEKAPRSPREAGALSLPPGSPRPHDFGAPARRGPRGRGPRGPRARGAEGRAGFSSDGPPASPPWAASPGGPHGSSPPKSVCPGRKGFALQCTKASRSGRALKSPGRGGGRPEAGERGGGAAAGGEGRSAGRADGRAGREGCGAAAATNVFAEKFCSQVGGREIVTQLKAGKSRLKKIKLQKGATGRCPGGGPPTPLRRMASPGPENPGRPLRARLLAGRAGPAGRSGERAGGIGRGHLGASTCLLPARGGSPAPLLPPRPRWESEPRTRGPRRPVSPRVPHRASSAWCGGAVGVLSHADRPFPIPRLQAPHRVPPGPGRAGNRRGVARRARGDGPKQSGDGAY